VTANIIGTVGQRQQPHRQGGHSDLARVTCDVQRAIRPALRERGGMR
jgi:hypothetical protein